ncbi:hypothetical protein [Streptomyces sp. C10-9-1]
MRLVTQVSKRHRVTRGPASAGHGLAAIVCRTGLLRITLCGFSGR